MKRKTKKVITFSLIALVVGLILFFMFYLSKNKIDIDIIQNESGYFAVLDMGHPGNKNYHLIIKNQSHVIIHEEEIKNRITKIDLLYPNFGDIYTAYISEYNRNNERIQSTKSVDFMWDTPTFDRSGSYIINKDRLRVLEVDGNIEENYEVVFMYNKQTIDTVKISNGVVSYPQELFNYDKQKITAYLMDGEIILDKKNVYVNVSPIEEIKINNLLANEEYTRSNIDVSTKGGIGANIYRLQLIVNDIVIFQQTKNEPNFTIVQSYLRSDMAYTIRVIAQFDDYYELAKTDEVGIIIRSEEYVYPVYTNTDLQIDYGQEIILGNVLQDVTIYYTNDGSDPSYNNGTVYTKPISLLSNTTIKAIAYNQFNYASVISNFEFKIEKNEVVIYVSPSRQAYNHGHRSTLYSNEKIIMNRLADVLIPKLKEKGFIVYRNNPKDEMDVWLNQSKKVKSDVHLALHSNGSKNHDQRGVKTYIDYDTNKTYSLANSIQEHLMSIYPYKLNPNNGITYAENSLGEVRTSQIPQGILLEIGYHDDYNDAMWIISSLEEIAQSITDALSEYYRY